MDTVYFSAGRVNGAAAQSKWCQRTIKNKIKENLALEMQIVMSFKFDGTVKSRQGVMPAKAGIQNTLKLLDSSLRWNDATPTLFTFYNFIKFDYKKCSKEVSMHCLMKPLY